MRSNFSERDLAREQIEDCTFGIFHVGNCSESELRPLATEIADKLEIFEANCGLCFRRSRTGLSVKGFPKHKGASE